MTFTRRISAQAVPVYMRVLTAPPTLYLKSHCGLNKLTAYLTPFSGINDLWEHTQREWKAIDIAVVQNLIESMPRRVEEVIKARGRYTNY